MAFSQSAWDSGRASASISKTLTGHKRKEILSPAILRSSTLSCAFRVLSDIRPVPRVSRGTRKRSLSLRRLLASTIMGYDTIAPKLLVPNPLRRGGWSRRGGCNGDAISIGENSRIIVAVLEALRIVWPSCGSKVIRETRNGQVLGARIQRSDQTAWTR